MFRNYLLVALRSLRRHWGYASLNVVGLGVGMAACLLIGLYVHDELQADRFHPNADRIVQVGSETPWQGRGTFTPHPLAEALETQVPGVERAVRAQTRHAMRVVHEASGLERTHPLLYTEPAFFEIFSFPGMDGDPVAALAQPDGLVLAESVARTFFGREDVVGETLRIGSGAGARDVTVRAVVREAPVPSTVSFEMAGSIELIPEMRRSAGIWRAFSYQTYALLAAGTPAEAVEARLPEVVAPHFDDDPPRFFVASLPSVYLSDLHTPSGFRGQAKYLYIFGFAALFVLLIAGINYVNLATAQGLRRSREIGVRKSVGAGRAQVARQFLTESLLQSSLALVGALALVALVLPAFNPLFGKDLTLGGHPGALVALTFFVLAVGALAGGYPALVLSRFEPVRVLRGQGTGSTGRGLLRQFLIVLQFSASSVLLIGTAVIYAQVQYMQTKDLGFEGDQVVGFNLPMVAWDQAEAIRQEALAHPGVLQASASSEMPPGFVMGLGFTAGAITTAATVDAETVISIRPARVDAHFIETLGLRLAVGRGFDAGRPSDEHRAIVINEAAARAVGWTPEEAIGKPFRLGFGDVEMGEIIGVVEDFHVRSLHEEVPPVGLQMHGSPHWAGNVIVVARLSPDHIAEAMRHLEARLAPFALDGRVTHTFLDEAFHHLYEAEIRLGRVFTTFAGLAILVACLGLFGLAAHAAQVRTKEIGVRKTLGASVASIVALLSADFLKLVAIAVVLGAPAASYVMGRWLEDFAYRIDIGPGVFILTAAVAIGVALITVGSLAYRAALSDPVRALRTE